MTILGMLRAGEGLSDAERALADYVISHASEIPSASITELAERSFTSNATVIRLSRKLGFSGYRELRVRLAAELASFQSRREDVDTNRPFHADDGVEGVMRGVSSLAIGAIEACQEMVSPEVVETAATMLRTAGNIFLYAYGDSYISCLAFANQLLKLGVRCIMASQYHEEAVNARSAMRGDAALIVTYSGLLFGRDAESVRILKERGCHIIAVTARPDIAEEAGADVVIPMPSGEVRGDKIASYFSQTCIHYVLNCLYGAVFAFDFEENELWKNWVDG